MAFSFFALRRREGDLSRTREVSDQRSNFMLGKRFPEIVGHHRHLAGT